MNNKTEIERAAYLRSKLYMDGTLSIRTKNCLLNGGIEPARGESLQDFGERVRKMIYRGEIAISGPNKIRNLGKHGFKELCEWSDCNMKQPFNVVQCQFCGHKLKPDNYGDEAKGFIAILKELNDRLSNAIVEIEKRRC